MTDLHTAAKQALEALELAQDNLRDHGDNCFLHDEGEYNRCFCGKDSLSNHLQSVVEKLDEALTEQPAPVAKPHEQEPVAWMCHPFGDDEVEYGSHQECENCIPLYKSPQPSQSRSDAKPAREWVSLSEDEIDFLELKYAPPIHPDFNTDVDHCYMLIKKTEAKLREKNT